MPLPRSRPRGGVVVRAGLALLAGALGGWLAGLLRAPRSRDRSTDRQIRR